MSNNNFSKAENLPKYAEIAGNLALHFTQGGTLKDLFQYTQSELEAAYTLGYSLYQQEHYDEALRIFAFLVTNDHLNREYLMAFASCSQMLKKFQAAIEIYTMASVMDMSDPTPTFRTAECMIAIGMINEAEEALNFVIEQSKSVEQIQLRQRAEAILKLLHQGNSEVSDKKDMKEPL